MSKFLDILEQHDPANQSKMDAAFQAKFFLYENEIPFSSQGSKIILHAEQGDIVLEAIKIKPRNVEDLPEEENYEVNPNDIAKDVSQKYREKPLMKRIGNSIINSGEKQVDRAVNNQAKMYPELANYVNKQTDAVKKALQNAKHKIKLR